MVGGWWRGGGGVGEGWGRGGGGVGEGWERGGGGVGEGGQANRCVKYISTKDMFQFLEFKYPMHDIDRD